MKPAQSPKFALIKGAMWTVGARWTVKGIGFLNTMVMARLLVPADYGIVGMAMLVVGLAQAFMDFGATTALLRKNEVTADEIDSAWTLKLIQGLLVALALVMVSPWAASYFTEPRVVVVLWVLAVCVLLDGASNIGLTLAQKAFDFSLEFRLNVMAKLLGVVATIIAGHLLGDYRALVIGIATGFVATLVLSYLMHPYRPRWNTKKIGQIWAVTKWLLFASVGQLLLRKSDEFVAARIGSTEEYGTYYVGADLGGLPVAELGPAMLRAFLPVLSSIKDDLRRTNDAVIKTLSAVNTLTLPVAFGVAAVTVPLTHFVLGEKWVAAAPLVAVFALIGAAQFVVSPLRTLLILHGHTRSQSTTVWIEFLAFCLAAAFLAPQHHLIGLAWARLLASLSYALATTLITRHHCGLAFTAVLSAVWRPLAGAILMYVLVGYVLGWLDGSPLQLPVAVLAGAAFFTVWTLSTWWLFGRPQGLESTLADALRPVA